MSFLVTRGLGQQNLVTGGLGGSLGTITLRAIDGALTLTGTLLTSFIEAEDDDRTNAFGRRFFGSFFGPSHKGHN